MSGLHALLTKLFKSQPKGETPKGGFAERRALPVTVAPILGSDGSTRQSLIAFGDGQDFSGQSWRSQIEARLAEVAPARTVVGLIAPTGPLLIDAWKACVTLGHTPIILHYPTPKLSRIYWQSEMEHAIASVGVEVLLCADPSCVPRDCCARVITLETILPEKDDYRTFQMPDDSTFLQMSSGTTGFRKGILFNFRDVKEHVARYNEILNIVPEDCIVSWLPLYHDMGFVATFLMPQILSCREVLLDPITWIRQPEMLWSAIDKYGGTICYMPNFGYEVMASRAQPCPASMRLWVSCSEPTRIETMERFAAATFTPMAMIANCWGMAENIFAVCQQAGIATRSFEGAAVVSCGRPIPSVEVKVVDGEIFVRSPYSLKQYVSLQITLDSDGYYATGDVGEIRDGEVYLRGRQHDVMNSAGRKTLLSDIDFIAGEEIPEAAGRIASFEVFDEKLGTGALTVLVEDPEFWRRNKDGETIRRIIARTGMETARVSFVPPRFVTKTSSGKINRNITRVNWLRREITGNNDTTIPNADRARNEIEAVFPWLDLTMSLSTQIDSLGLVNLNLIASKYGFEGEIHQESSVDNLLMISNSTHRTDETLKIISLCDGNPFKALATEAIQQFCATQDSSVQFKNICVPPLPVLLSDLIFADYFQCRDDDQAAYEPLRRVLADIRGASVILIDDSTTLFWPQSESKMLYPQISHDFQSTSESRLLAVRWAGYSENHDRLRFHIVAGTQMLRENVNSWIKDLSDYLSVPVVRIAYGSENSDLTKDWEVQAHSTIRGVTAEWNFDGVDRSAFSQQLYQALISATYNAPRRTGDDRSFINFSDQPHWCSWTVNPALLDFIVDHFDNIAVLGKSSSVPYLFDKAREKGKRVQIRADLSVPEDCDCVVQTGSWGKPNTDKPLFQVMAAGWIGEPAINLSPALQAICPSNR